MNADMNGWSDCPEAERELLQQWERHSGSLLMDSADRILKSQKLLTDSSRRIR